MTKKRTKPTKGGRQRTTTTTTRTSSTKQIVHNPEDRERLTGAVLPRVPGGRFLTRGDGEADAEDLDDDEDLNADEEDFDDEDPAEDEEPLCDEDLDDEGELDELRHEVARLRRENAELASEGHAHALTAQRARIARAAHAAGMTVPQWIHACALEHCSPELFPDDVLLRSIHERGRRFARRLTKPGE